MKKIVVNFCLLLALASGLIAPAHAQSGVISVTDYGALCNGSTDDTTAINSAIATAQVAAAARGGTATVALPAGNCHVAGTIQITGNSVTLAGIGMFATILSCSNAGISDCMVIGGQVSQVTGITIRDMQIQAPNRTGGNCVQINNASRVLISRVNIQTCWNGVLDTVTNTVIIEHSRIVGANAGVGGYLVKWSSPANNTQRSDVFTLFDVSMSASYSGADCIDLDGMVQTMHLTNVIVQQCNYGLRVQNTAASNSFYPAFLYAHDVEIEGAQAAAVRIDAGHTISFTNSDFYNFHGAGGQGNTDTDCLIVNPDTGFSNTHNIRFTAGRIGGCANRAANINGQQVHLVDVQFTSISQAGANAAPAIEVGANASAIELLGILTFFTGDTVNASWALTVDSGAQGVLFQGDCRGAIQGCINNPSNITSLIVLPGFDQGGNPFGVVGLTPQGTFSDFVHDDAPSINAALQTAFANGGGWVLLNPNKPYWANTQITVPQGVTLGCVAPPQKFPSPGSQFNKDFTNQGCAVYESAAATPMINKGSIINARIYTDQYHFAGKPTTVHQLYAITACYAGGATCPNVDGNGTGIQQAAFDTILRDVTIGGFNLGVDEESQSRGIMQNVLIEAQNCIFYGVIGDYIKGDMIECWPFASTDGSTTALTNITSTISNIADNGSGAWRVTLSAAPSEAYQLNDEVYIGGTGSVVGIPPGAMGRHFITAVNSTTSFDLGTAVGTPSQDAPTISATTTTGSAFVTVPATTNLWSGMTFTGTCFTGTRTIEQMYRSQLGFFTDANATSTGACTLTFNLQTFSAPAGTPQMIYDARGGLHGTGIEVSGVGVILNNVYVWAHDTALQFDSSTFANNINQFTIDSIGAEYRSERTGILFQSNTNQNFIQGFAQSSGGTFIVNNSNVGTGHENIVMPGRVTAFVNASVENNTTGLILAGFLDPDGVGVGPAFNANLVNGKNIALQLTAGTRISGTLWSTGANANGINQDNTSTIASNTSGQTSTLVSAWPGSFLGGQFFTNQPLLRGAATGGPPNLTAIGGDTNINMALLSKGTGSVTLNTNSGGDSNGNLFAAGTTFSQPASGNIAIMGSMVGGTNLTNSGVGALYTIAGSGLTVQGKGTSNDVVIRNNNGNPVTAVPTGTQSFQTFGAQISNVGTVRTTNYTIGAIDYQITMNCPAACTITLPTASTSTGRWLLLKTIGITTPTSASANVVPLAGGAAGTTIFTAGAGRFAILQSDGTSWQTQWSN